MGSTRSATPARIAASGISGRSAVLGSCTRVVPAEVADAAQAGGAVGVRARQEHADDPSRYASAADSKSTSMDGRL